MKSYVVRYKGLKSVDKRASWTLSSSKHGPVMCEGVMALLWMMHSPEGHIGTVKDNSREVKK